jgi:hypothetical protein
MQSGSRDIRKRIVQNAYSPGLDVGISALDVSAITTVIVTSEKPTHPIELIFDGKRGPGASQWRAATPGRQSLILDFDKPQALYQLVLDIEETEVSRTQILWVSVSSDGGRNYHELIRQEYNFSPPGTTYEYETWTIDAPHTTHLAITIVPDKSGQPAYASVTSLILI